MQRAFGATAVAEDWANELNNPIHQGWKIESMHVTPCGDYSINGVVTILRPEENA